MICPFMLSLLSQSQFSSSTPLNVIFLIVLTVSKPMFPILSSWSSLLFPGPVAGPHLPLASPKLCRLMIPIHSRSEFRCLLHGAWMEYCHLVSATAQSEVSQSHGSAPPGSREQMERVTTLSVTLRSLLWGQRGCGHQKGCSWTSKMCKTGSFGSSGEDVGGRG